VPSLKLTPLKQEDRVELTTWLAEHGSSLPAPVKVALEQYSALCEGLLGSRYKLSQVLVELRRALGITAKSERRTSKDPLGPISNGDGRRPKSEREKLQLCAARCQSLETWHKEMAKRHRRTAKAMQRKLMKLPDDDTLADEADDKLTEAEMAEVNEHVARLQLGDGAQSAFESSKEAFITGAHVATSEDTVRLPVPFDEKQDGKLLDTITEERERFDFSFTVRRVTVQVEKKVVEGTDGERRIISASTASLGPKRYAVTWDFLAHMAVLVVQYAMPMNRLATLLSTEAKRFTAGGLSRMLRYVAQRFAPIYLTLFDSLCDSNILAGDDTSCRVIEVSRYFATARDSPSPWQEYRTSQVAKDLLGIGDKTLAVALASELGFEFERRTGDGAKKALHTTTLSGRSDPNEPRSLIVFYRSHLGGFGNLLETLLAKRSPKEKSLTVQTDLSTVNLVADKQLQRLFDIRQVGCASHARRPFALYENEDPDLCGAMLHMFKGLFIHEHALNNFGRNEQNVAAVRDIDSRKHWRDIKEIAETMCLRWSRETKLGEGARYVIRNFDKLTAYLDNPRLDLTSRVEDRRGGVQVALGRIRRFRLRARIERTITPFPAPASSNRTGGFPASGSPRRRLHIGVMIPSGRTLVFAAA
jgi:hypothetical protein